MTMVMVSSKEQIVLKLFDERAITKNFVGLCSLKNDFNEIPATDCYNNVMW